MADHHSGGAPYAPMRGILLPAASILLSVPTILIGGFFVVSGAFDLLSGHSLYAGGQQVVQLPIFGCLYLALGPVIALMVCITQRTRAEQVYGSALLLGFRIKRLNRVALWCAALALATLPLIVLVVAFEISLHPH